MRFCADTVTVTGYRPPNNPFPYNPDIFNYSSNSALPPTPTNPNPAGSGTPTSKNPAKSNQEDCTTKTTKTGSPVLISTGLKVFDDIDYTAEGDFGVVMDRHFSRYYYGGILGTNWYTQFDKRLRFQFIDTTDTWCTSGVGAISSNCSRQMDATTLKNISSSDGNTAYNFQWSAADAAWLASGTAKSKLQLTQNTNGTWLLLKEDGTSELYHKNGRLESITNANGLFWQLTYDSDSSNKLQKITHSSGRQYTFGWGSNNLVSTMTDPFGNQIKYTYLTLSSTIILESITYANGDIKKYTYDGPAMPISFSINGVQHTEYTYYKYLDNTYSNNYDGYIRVATSGKVNGIEKSTFTYNANTTVVTNAMGGVTTYHYDSAAVKRLKNIDRSSTSNCPLASAVSEYVADTSDLLYKEDWKGNRTTYVYDADHRLIKEYFNGRTKEYIWDAQNRLITERIWDGAIAGITCKIGEACPTANALPKREKIYAYYGSSGNNRL